MKGRQQSARLWKALPAGIRGRQRRTAIVAASRAKLAWHAESPRHRGAPGEMRTILIPAS